MHKQNDLQLYTSFERYISGQELHSASPLRCITPPKKLYSTQTDPEKNVRYILYTYIDTLTNKCLQNFLSS